MFIKKLIKETHAIGMISKSSNNGGTYDVSEVIDDFGFSILFCDSPGDNRVYRSTGNARCTRGN